MYILAIESSCDETACAIVKDGVECVASTVSSSAELHEKTGGIVPEIAARKQVEYIVPVIENTVEKAQKALNLSSRDELIKKIDAIAVTVGPGLIGSLLVGVEAAKALSVAWDKPLIPVNHLVGHIYSTFVLQLDGGVSVRESIPEFPAVALIVSGGHTDLVLLKDFGEMVYIGGTLDDAAGEAFDKVARLLGLSNYLGGVLVSKKSAECKVNSLAGKLPRVKINDDDYDFSFSGLKTAVKRLVESGDYLVEDVCCEFENAVVDVLVAKTMRAVKEFNVKSVLLCGGVAANKHLRTRLEGEVVQADKKFYVPPISLCGDNAIYIASTAFFVQTNAHLEKILANPSLGVMDLF